MTNRLLTVLLASSSTAFTFPASPFSRTLHLHDVTSGDDLRDERAKSFSPIQTVVTTSASSDHRYSNQVSSHISTLYDEGTIVQDSIMDGSASRHTAHMTRRPMDDPSRRSEGQAIHEFRHGSASKHTIYDGSIHTNDIGNTFHDNHPSSLFPLLGNKHFQLEELEDAEQCTTDIYFTQDHTLVVGKTDGPLFFSGNGTWSTRPDNDKTLFEMILTRRYQTGTDKHQQSTDIGEFEYNVERTYRGEMTLIGESMIAMNGEIYDVDEIFGERRVGFFNMIDTTEARKEDSVV